MTHPEAVANPQRRVWQEAVIFMVSGRRMRRLERFAFAYGMHFAVQPAGERRAASFFVRSDHQDAVAWFDVPGTKGFEVAQHIERVDIGGADNKEMKTRWTWAVFTLRQSGRVADATAAGVWSMLPRRWSVEVVRSELFLVTNRNTSLTSPRLWRMLREVQQVLHPVLAHPARTSSLAERERRRVVCEITGQNGASDGMRSATSSKVT